MNLLIGENGHPVADLDRLRELLLRVARLPLLADDLLEVAKLNLNLVIAKPHGVIAADARTKVTPCQPHDPFLRRLR